MAESTLSVDYQTLVREAARKFGNGQAYSDGVVTVAAGVVTISGGAWPSWAAACAFQIGDSVYAVASRTDATTLVLSDTTVNAGQSRYVLVQTTRADRQLGLVEIRDFINEALRQFYAPHMVEVQRIRKTIDGNESPAQSTQEIAVMQTPHIWSFLRPTASLTLVAGEAAADLPDDCGQSTSEWMVFVNGIAYPLVLLREGQLKSIRRGGRGIPKYCAVSPKSAFDPSIGQRFEVLFDIEPDQAYTVEYSYTVIPNALNPTNCYPMGGAFHGEAIRAAVMARIEMALECAGGAHAQEFDRRLQASLQYDLEVREAEQISYAVEAPPMGTYEWLLQEVAAFTGDNANYRAWTYTTAAKVNSYVQRGLNMFYRAEMSPVPTHKGHKWSFLRPPFSLELHEPYSTGTITAVKGVVTLSGGELPEWAVMGCELNVDGTRVRVASFVSPTKFVLEREVDFDAGSEYSLEQNFIRMMPGFSGIDGPLFYDRSNGMRRLEIKEFNYATILRYRQTWGTTNPTQPNAYCIVPRNDVKGTYREMVFWPPPNQDLVVYGTARIDPPQLGPGEYFLGGPQHYEAVLWACKAAANPRMMPAFKEALAASIEIDQSEFAPASVGLCLDRSDYRRYKFGWRHYFDGQFYFNGVREF